MKQISKAKYFSILAIAILSIIIPIGNPNSICLAQADSTDFDLSSINDGPYVLLQTGSTGIAFYVCDGFFEYRNLELNDTIMFQGFCQDTGEVYTITSDDFKIDPDVYENISKIVTVSDIHGRYDLFEDILIKSKVIDEHRHWIFGDGHLVIDGDIFDRGEYVTECLWLIFRLEQEAEKSGGAVHFILGNHELMVIQADNRYINEKYMKGIVEVTTMPYEFLFGRSSILGRWLRSKHTIVKLNDILFTHGGIAPSMIEKGVTIQEINNEVRQNIEYNKKSAEISDMAKYLFGSEGPFWYRGYLYEVEDRYRQATSDDIDNILSYFDVKSIVVGHTGIDQIEGFYDNRVINEHKTLDSATTEALLWENDKFYRITSAGEMQMIN